MIWAFLFNYGKGLAYVEYHPTNKCLAGENLTQNCLKLIKKCFSKQIQPWSLIFWFEFIVYFITLQLHDIILDLKKSFPVTEKIASNSLRFQLCVWFSIISIVNISLYNLICFPIHLTHYYCQQQRKCLLTRKTMWRVHFFSTSH